MKRNRVHIRNKKIIPIAVAFLIIALLLGVFSNTMFPSKSLAAETLTERRF